MSPRILIVDDEPDLMEILLILFQAFGFETATAFNGHDALTHVRTTPPDIVLMDVMMPQMSGYEVCRTLKADPRTCDIPVVMLSARAQAEDRVAGFEAGADGYVVKPFDNVELVQEVQRVLERSRPR